jgi:hypothetical protein
MTTLGYTSIYVTRVNPTLMLIGEHDCETSQQKLVHGSISKGLLCKKKEKEAGRLRMKSQNSNEFLRKTANVYRQDSTPACW